MLTTVVQSAFGFAFWLVAARLFPAHVVGLIAAHHLGQHDRRAAGQPRGWGHADPIPRRPSGPSAGWSVTFWAGMVTATAICIAIGCGLLISPAVLDRGSWPFSATRRTPRLFVVGTLTMAGGAVLDYVFIAERAAGNMLLRNTIVAGGKLVMVACCWSWRVTAP